MVPPDQGFEADDTGAAFGRGSSTGWRRADRDAATSGRAAPARQKGCAGAAQAGEGLFAMHGVFELASKIRRNGVITQLFEP
jgi:hypothetical protein